MGAVYMGLCAMSLECDVGVVVRRPSRLSLTPKPACANNEEDKEEKWKRRTHSWYRDTLALLADMSAEKCYSNERSDYFVRYKCVDHDNRRFVIGLT
jgi:hypothetical protein